MKSEVSAKDRDCVSCRMVSGTGLLGIGAYLGYYARKNPTTSGKLIISTFSFVFIYGGVARYSQIYPFDRATREATTTST